MASVTKRPNSNVRRRALNAESKATVRDNVLGPGEGAMQSVTKGLDLGEVVILEGLDRLREGRVVTVLSEDPAKNQAAAKGERGGGKGKKKQEGK